MTCATLLPRARERRKSATQSLNSSKRIVRFSLYFFFFHIQSLTHVSKRCCQLSGDCVCCCVAFRPARSESELASASLYHSLPLKYVFHLRISQEDWTGWWTVKLVWLCFKIVYLKHNGHSLEMDASVFADRLSKPSILRNIWITHWTITTLSGLRDKRRLGNDQPSVDFG